MQEAIKIAVDAMGGDNAPQEIVKGAVDAVNERKDVHIFLVGHKSAVETELRQRNRLYWQSAKKSSHQL